MTDLKRLLIGIPMGLFLTHTLFTLGFSLLNSLFER